MATNGYLIKTDENGVEDVLYPTTSAEYVNYDNNTNVAAKISSIEGVVNTNTGSINTITSELSAEVNARDTGDAALNARIDNLLNGTASEDVEILDSHVNGINAETYTSLKNRLDGDFDYLCNQITVLQDLERRLKSGSIEDADLHFGLYIDEDGDICQKEEE